MASSAGNSTYCSVALHLCTVGGYVELSFSPDSIRVSAITLGLQVLCQWLPSAVHTIAASVPVSVHCYPWFASTLPMVRIRCTQICCALCVSAFAGAALQQVGTATPEADFRSLLASGRAEIAFSTAPDAISSILGSPNEG